MRMKRTKKSARKRKIYKILASQIVDTVGLVGWWKLHDGLMATGKVFDYSLNGHVGTLVDTDDPITLKPTYPGFDFDGANDYIEVADHNDFSFGDGSNDSPFSISAWVYPEGVGDYFPIAVKIDTGNYEWRFYIYLKTLHLLLHNPTGDVYVGRYYTTELSTGQWYHVGVTCDGRGGADAEDGIKLYLDGTRVDNADKKSGTYVAMDNGTAPLWIGRYASQYIDGKIGDVMIYNVEKTAAQIKSLYDQTRSKYSV